ncbi:MAG: 1-acyl-sn-glycerol-3-phosphate acyltransferase [Flavobacteriaceae bacterium]|nr:1-acyl-sn-glycerol-3-phosphate acyltransferase [Flavobacteriaceae bacterium]
MAHILSYPMTVIFYLLFGLVLVVFHLIQLVCYTLISYKAHKKSVDFLNFFILAGLRVLGTSFQLKTLKNYPKDVPIIVVSNHQSLWDIPPLIWHLRSIHPKFVSKIELGKGIPSVSYNLRYGGAVLIDRKNPRQAITALMNFADYLNQHNRSAVIFPEGTRSKTNVPKKFQRKGLAVLIKKMPEAYVLPVTINNSWKLQKHGMFPMPLGVRVCYKLHPFMKISDFDTEILIDTIESQINSEILIK